LTFTRPMWLKVLLEKIEKFLYLGNDCQDMQTNFLWLYKMYKSTNKALSKYKHIFWILVRKESEIIVNKTKTQISEAIVMYVIF